MVGQDVDLNSSQSPNLPDSSGADTGTPQSHLQVCPRAHVCVCVCVLLLTGRLCVRVDIHSFSPFSLSFILWHPNAPPSTPTLNVEANTAAVLRHVLSFEFHFTFHFSELSVLLRLNP